jgi:predicted ATPase
MLRYLAAHPGRLVTKAEVQQHVWAGTHVTPNVLRVCVREIRVALGDAAGAPRYLVTVGHQGYRWLGGADLEAPPPRPAGLLVGRQDEVEFLTEWGQRAAHGTRQLVFVSGEAGVGKTTVVEMYLARLAAGGEGRTVRGQCIEHTGEGEPYLPFLEALGQLGQGPERDKVRAVLRQYAPLWLAHLPGLVSEADLERLQGRLHGATPARMLRELAEALEVLTADRLLVLLLEDLQWSDRSTVEGLAYLAQRSAPARLLVLGTYRPVEVLLQGHPLRGTVQELCGRGQGVDLRLEFLSTADVAAYVAGRLGGPVAAALPAFIYTRTDGNALFLVNMVEHLVQQGAVVRRAGQWTRREDAGTAGASLPEGLRGLLLRRIEALPPATRRVLEAASVAGETFTVAAVAAGVQGPIEDVEAVCVGLAAQQHVLDDAGWRVWPDATSGGRYRFQHALYQQVLYEALGTARRVQLHQDIGTRLEAGYGARVGEIAARLAVHFERAGAVQRAVHYWQQAGEEAGRRYAYPEALAALRKGLALLAFGTVQGLEHHVVFGRLLLGWALAMQGDAAAGVAHIHEGLERLQRTGLKLYRPYFLALLAEASGLAGQPEAGLTALAEAVTRVAATEERCWEAEVYRLQGVLLLQHSRADSPQAEACFQQALDVARRQQAKALELRAALSLARLWQGQGKRAAACQLLAEIYGWFTEGFDTADLQEAKALLQELGA